MSFLILEWKKALSNAGKLILRLRKIAEITRKLCGKFHFKIRESSTELHRKLRVSKKIFDSTVSF